MLKNKPIKKILIPNRGEIAVRIQRTCRELNILTVAVFSEPDRHALHVRYADEAYHLPGASAEETYLHRELIFDIAKKSRADAIHPGYGFLSENAEFVSECLSRGLIFIGPSSEAIKLMGLKTESRRIMAEAGVPIIPGTSPLKSVEDALSQALNIGFPVLIKASAGGGGKGMRRVNSPNNIESAFNACRREAQSSFGNPQVFMEKYLDKPRHIEFQILGDLHGNIIHLYERECSIQRRHQKIIEETPSLALDEKKREVMGDAAIKVAKACSYTNAGTVEFLVDSDRNFYFLEMNTRLQVEHPVTEMVTGMDIVEQQIRIAEGEAISTEPVSRNGASIECRIYAEDPDNNFLPSPGLIKGLIDPGGPGIRNDSGIYSGYTIPKEYDPMISKLVVWGKNRDQAISRMLRALEEYHLLGIRTNIRFLGEIIKHPNFLSGNFDTHFIQNHKNELKPSLGENSDSVALATAAVISLLNNKKPEPVATQGKGESSSWKQAGRKWGMNKG